MATKVYRYALRAPHDNAQLVHEQMRLAHQYRNRLVEIERARRAEIRAMNTSIIGPLEDSAQAAGRAVEAVVENVRRIKAASRSRKVPDTLRDALNTARVLHRDAKVAVKMARKALVENEDLVARKDEIEERYNAMRRDARSKCGVYWGTYLLIEDADKAARSSLPLYQPDGVTPNDPIFVRWTGEGRVAVQIQGGMSVDDLKNSTRVQIHTAPLPPGADPNSKKSQGRRYIEVSLRVGSGGDGGRSPVWARWKGIMHRSLPADAIIKWAQVVLSKNGPHEEWHLLLTFDSELVVRPAPGNRKAVAVDIGWRVREDGLRVAAWRDTDGQHGFLVLSEELLSQIRYAETLRSIRDKSLDRMRDQLVPLLGLLQLPEWFPKNTYQWRSAARFASLANRWRDNRFDGDSDAFLTLEGWSTHDFHLWQWESAQRLKALRRREVVYRRFAADMSYRYDDLVIEAFNIRDVAERPAVDQQEGDNEAARANRQLASTSELRLALRNAFGAPPTRVGVVGRAGRLVVAPAEYTTKICSYCGSEESWNQAAEVEHTCSNCHTRWDQDDNATRNLLHFHEQTGGSPNPEAARDDENPINRTPVRESRWSKARRMSDEKKRRREVARNPVANVAE